MEELLLTLARGLVDDPDGVSVAVDEPNEEGIIFYHLRVSEADMGRVIGKQGKIAKAIRTIMRSAAVRNHMKISVEIDE
ncbi:MAG: KH domain-containing protein [Oscillospiraceae bacterium]|nr:KH domain-containing protein [Oscillospiraceae bacterium]